MDYIVFLNQVSTICLDPVAYMGIFIMDIGREHGKYNNSAIAGFLHKKRSIRREEEMSGYNKVRNPGMNY